MFYLTPNIAVTSVLNPGMRVFDVVVRSDYGTSYNSYTVIGSEGVALIDTAHHNFQDCYFNNVDDSLKGKTPRYLIVNHAEPDHSGAIPDLLGIYPDLTILCTASAAINLKNITNRDDLPIQVVKDGDSISLGDRTLEFMMAPFLHWPDTMFTWCPEEKVLFTCDFLGCHYCEPQYLDSLITYPKAYDKSLEQYFGAIFSPFIEYVQKGLAKIDGLDIEHVCTSHGPILTKGVLLEEVVRRYHAWSDPVKHDVLQVPVFYCTAYGNTA
ncbi:MAG: FprA family A-type flavoprotein, partial [Coriobacteriia bacterium]|nr:FprA family A-type flavoprotein [Coriobacteriia bacterium]